MEPGGDSLRQGVLSKGEVVVREICGMNACDGAMAIANSGGAGEYLTLCCRTLALADGVFVQQPWEASICMSPHWSAIWRQHSFSSSLIIAPGTAQASNGDVRSVSAMVK